MHGKVCSSLLQGGRVAPALMHESSRSVPRSWATCMCGSQVLCAVARNQGRPLCLPVYSLSLGACPLWHARLQDIDMCLGLGMPGLTACTTQAKMANLTAAKDAAARRAALEVGLYLEPTAGG